MKTTVLIAGAILFTALSSQAAVITWTNVANGNWSVAANWNPNQVPNSNDTVVIETAGTYTVMLNVDAAIRGLSLGGAGGTQTVSLAGRTLTLNGTGIIHPRGVMTFPDTYATLEGSNQVVMEGNLNWGGGTIAAGSALTVAPGGRVTIASSANHAKFLSGFLTNNGVITWQLYGNLSVGGVLHNSAGGVFDAKADLGLYRSGNGRIINDGLFRKSAGAGTLDCQVPLINNGTVDTQVGRVTLADGSIFNSGCAFTGAGETRLDSGTNRVNGSIHSENLRLLHNATLTGTGTFTGILVWGGGAIGPEAAITIATNGQLLITSAATYGKSMLGRLTNAGTITWQPTGSLLINGVVHNLPGATFDAQLDGLISSSALGIIINDGVLRKSAGSGTVTVEAPLINNGTVETQIGRVTLADGSVFNSGCAFIGAGETRLESGTNTVSGTFHSENLVLRHSATLTGTGSFTGMLAWGGGTIGSNAAITVTRDSHLLIASSASYAKNLHGYLTNAGNITWQPQSSLVIGGMLHNAPGAVFDAQFDGTIQQGGAGRIVNEGTFQKSAGAQNTICLVPFINHGVTRVSSGTLQFGSGFTNPIGTIALAGGTIQTPQPLWLPGGVLTGWGTVKGDVTSAGSVRPSASNGVLRISGDYEQLLGGRVEFEINDQSAGTNQSRLQITGAARLRASAGVHWLDDQLPAPGADFTVLTFGSREGEFCCFDNLILLGHGLRLIPAYGPNSLTFSAVAVPDPTNVPFRVVADGGVLVSWPAEFTGFELYWNTNLNFTNWTLIPGISNRYLEPPPVPPRKYYLLRQSAPGILAPRR